MWPSTVGSYMFVPGGMTAVGRILSIAIVQMPSQGADIGERNGIMLRELILNGQIECLLIRGEEVVLPSIEGETGSIDRCGIFEVLCNQGISQSGRCSSGHGQRSLRIHCVEINGIGEGIVPPDVIAKSDVVQRSIGNAVAAANHCFGSQAVGKADAGSKVKALRVSCRFVRRTVDGNIVGSDQRLKCG